MAVTRSRFTARLKRSSSLLIDTAPLIYHLEDIEPWSELTDIALGLIGDGVVAGVLSTISVTELLVKPFQLSHPDRIAACEEFLLAMPNTTIVAPDFRIARRGAELRARHNLRMPDALICATALDRGAVLLTNDDALDRAGIDGLEILLMSRYVR